MPIRRDDRIHGGLTVTTILIDHPPLNILDLEHCQELASVLAEVRADDRARVLVLRGAGRAFSAGVDIKEHTPAVMPALLPAFHAIFHGLLGLQTVNIAVVHGLCMGGAAELAFACDRVVMEETVRVSFPEILVGCYPPVAIPLLTQRAGIGRAVEAILGGAELPVRRLESCGMVDRVAATGALDDALAEELAMYAHKSPGVLGMTARLLHMEAERTWGSRIPFLEKEYLEILIKHPDVDEGVRSFIEKRKPRWKTLNERIDIDRVEGMAQ